MSFLEFAGGIPAGLYLRDAGVRSSPLAMEKHEHHHEKQFIIDHGFYYSL